MWQLQHAELPPKNIYRSTRIPLVGRDTELGEVLSSLHKHGAAVLWAGPGEGKSALALEAACREWEAGRCLGGCLSVDMKGACLKITSHFTLLVHNKVCSGKLETISGRCISIVPCALPMHERLVLCSSILWGRGRLGDD